MKFYTVLEKFPKLVKMRLNQRKNTYMSLNNLIM